MAHYVAAGAAVTLVTCTLGEEGEILLPSLALLTADQADQLGGWRIAELATAMGELGVTDHRFLAGAGRFRDSGMMGDAANAKPRAFWRADSVPAIFDTAVAALVEVLREVRPQVVVTYDDVGGYGHPDHIMAHRVTTAAVRAAAAPEFPGVLGDPWTVSKVYWTAMPRSVMDAGLERMKAAGGVPFASVESVDDLPFAVDDALITTVIHATDHSDAKRRALAAHGSQITVDGPFFALSNNLGSQILGVEYFRLASGTAGTNLDAEGRETDLFAGVGGSRDSASPDSASPDSASPDSASPDSASRDSASPDSASPDSASPDRAASE
jgi:N-acetyl-1-D-myo-inositol-2-amino-2-deoxy-alpha-D-glucopyranoside deacetylase